MWKINVVNKYNSKQKVINKKIENAYGYLNNYIKFRKMTNSKYFFNYFQIMQNTKVLVNIDVKKILCYFTKNPLRSRYKEKTRGSNIGHYSRLFL